MVMGHVGFGSIFDKWIHAFHMPMWFIISGFFINTDKDTLQYILRKMKTLLLPYVGFGIYYEIMWLIWGNHQWLGMLFPNSIQIPFNGALWFLPALFFADCISFVVLKYVPHYAWILLSCIAVVGNINFIPLPLSVDSALVGAGFILIGHLLKKFGNKVLKLKIWKACILFAVASVLSLVNGYVNVRANEYAFVPLFWINATLITVALCNIFEWVDAKTDLKILKEIGEQSIIYVCMNQFILLILDLFSIPLMNTLLRLLWRLAKVIITIMICFICNRIWNFLKSYFGKRGTHIKGSL